MRKGTTRVHLRIVSVCAWVGCGEGEGAELIHGQTFLSLCFLHSSDLRPQQSVPVLPELPTMASKKFGDTRAKFENNLGKIHYKVNFFYNDNPTSKWIGCMDKSKSQREHRERELISGSLWQRDRQSQCYGGGVPEPQEDGHVWQERPICAGVLAARHAWGRQDRGHQEEPQPILQRELQVYCKYLLILNYDYGGYFQRLMVFRFLRKMRWTRQLCSKFLTGKSWEKLIALER